MINLVVIQPDGLTVDIAVDTPKCWDQRQSDEYAMYWRDGLCSDLWNDLSHGPVNLPRAARRAHRWYQDNLTRTRHSNWGRWPVGYFVIKFWAGDRETTPPLAEIDVLTGHWWAH